MPSRKVHLRIDKMLFGKEFPQVHTYKDGAWMESKIRHRRVRHDFETALKLGVIYGWDAALSSLVHDMVDERLSKMVKKVVKYV
jgi:hypothetical protein